MLRWSSSEPSSQGSIEAPRPDETMLVDEAAKLVAVLGLFATLAYTAILAALAPKPVIVLAKEKDYFDARGNEAAYARLKRLYRLLGAENNVAYFIGPTYHGYSQENREAMYRWFNRCTKISDAQTEPALCWRWSVW